MAGLLNLDQISGVGDEFTTNVTTNDSEGKLVLLSPSNYEKIRKTVEKLSITQGYALKQYTDPVSKKTKLDHVYTYYVPNSAKSLKIIEDIIEVKTKGGSILTYKTNATDKDETKQIKGVYSGLQIELWDDFGFDQEAKQITYSKLNYNTYQFIFSGARRSMTVNLVDEIPNDLNKEETKA